MRKGQDYTTHWKTVTSRHERSKRSTHNWASKMPDIKWYNIEDLYKIEGYRIKHSKNPKTRWIRLPCVYKIKINKKVVHVGRSDTCKKHGGAEKVRKALVNLLNIHEYNPSVLKTKTWEQIRLQHKPNTSNISIGIIETNAIKKIYLQERI
jgi:hypothetical protein